MLNLQRIIFLFAFVTNANSSDGKPKRKVPFVIPQGLPCDCGKFELVKQNAGNNLTDSEADLLGLLKLKPCGKCDDSGRLKWNEWHGYRNRSQALPSVVPQKTQKLTAEQNKKQEKECYDTANDLPQLGRDPVWRDWDMKRREWHGISPKKIKKSSFPKTFLKSLSTTSEIQSSIILNIQNV